MRWVGGLIDVMHAEERRRVSPVEFDKHPTGLTAEGWCCAYRRSQNDPASGGNVACFKDCPVYGPKKPAANGLWQHRKVHIEETGVAGVDACAKIRVGLV